MSEPLSPASLAQVRAAISDGLLQNAVEEAGRRLSLSLDSTQIQQVVDSYEECDLYSSNLGKYILAQNPYADVHDIGAPQLPPFLNANVEIPAGGIWDRENHPFEPPDVLKAGVLKEKHSTSPLDVDRPVPFGTILPFGIIGPENSMYLDEHNIVKMLALRYTLTLRLKKNPDTRPGQPAKVPTNAYLIVCYSGGDT